MKKSRTYTSVGLVFAFDVPVCAPYHRRTPSSAWQSPPSHLEHPLIYRPFNHLDARAIRRNRPRHDAPESHDLSDFITLLGLLGWGRYIVENTFPNVRSAFQNRRLGAYNGSKSETFHKRVS